MLKIRLQGKLRDIRWLQRILEQQEEVIVKEISRPFPNKGTNQYFRVYVEIEKKEK